VNTLRLSDRIPLVGFEPDGKHRFATLHLARKAGRSWTYAGKVGTGLSGKVSIELRKTLDGMAVEKAVVALANRRRSTVAVKPALVANVEYRIMTADGQLRHASFKGLV
jgi:bifunctional non-homologous end joining protein LigD